MVSCVGDHADNARAHEDDQQCETEPRDERAAEPVRVVVVVQSVRCTPITTLQSKSSGPAAAGLTRLSSFAH